MFLLLASLIRADDQEEKIKLVLEQAKKMGCDTSDQNKYQGLVEITPEKSICLAGCHVFGSKSQLTADVSSNNGEAYKWNDQIKSYSNFNLIYDYQPIIKLTCNEKSNNCSVVVLPFECGQENDGKIILPKEFYVLYSLDPQTVEFDAQGDTSKGEYHRLDVSTDSNKHVKATISGENIGAVGAHIELNQDTKTKEMDVGENGLNDDIRLFSSAEPPGKYNGHFKFEITAKSSTSADDAEYKKMMELYPKIVGKVPNAGVFYAKDGQPADASKSGNDPKPKSGGLGGGAIAAIVIVVLLVIGGACAAVWFFVFRKKSDEAAA